MEHRFGFFEKSADPAAEQRWIGSWIRCKRLEKNWSQEGLCKGICTVSYLSKIEQGKVIPGSDILYALGTRLDENWKSLSRMSDIESAIEQGYESALNHSHTEFHKMQTLITEKYLHPESPLWLDIQLLFLWYGEGEGAQAISSLKPYENVMSPRQHILYLLLSDKEEQALRLYPCAETLVYMGIHEYRNGMYARAIEHLTEGRKQTADEGKLYLMLDASIFIANCYSDLHDISQMERHTRSALKIAKTLGETEAEKTIEYNIASTYLEIGRIEEAYRYFSALREPSALSLHKLAVACEQLGKKEEALHALEQISVPRDEYSGALWINRMCDLVRYRLNHPNYLKDDTYGTILNSTFNDMKAELPIGYASFHVPWMLEWMTANRMYKDAVKLLLDFPDYHL